MEVVFIDALTDPKHPGMAGLSDITWRLASEVNRLGVDVSITGFYEKNVAQPYPKINFKRITPSRIRLNNIFTILIERAMLVIQASQNQDANSVFHVSDVITAGFLSLLGLGHRTVWQGNLNVLHHSRFGNPWDRSTYLSLRFFTRLAARSIQYVIALGPSLVRWWKFSGFNSDAIIVIPNGIDPLTKLTEIDEIKVPGGWLSKENKILYVGRLAKDKGGYLEMLDCLHNLNRLEDSFGLLIIGDGPLKYELETYSRNHNNTETVFFHGSQPHRVVCRIYPRSDLVILPSKNEMMPRVMLEAWAYGTAFMGTDVGAVGDYLIDKYNGYLLNDLEPEYFFQRVKHALEDQRIRKRIVENGRQEVKKYTWSLIAKKYEDLYNRFQ